MTMMICNATLINSNVPSVSGRVYPVDVLKKIAKKDVVYGELSPTTLRTDSQIDQCSHKIVNLDVRNGVLYGDVQVLQNPTGELFTMVGQYKISKIEFIPRSTGKSNTDTDCDIIALDCYMNEDENDDTKTSNSLEK
jgi:hypothetical protein